MNYKGRKKLALIFVALMLVTACGKTDSKVDDKNTDIAIEEENATDKEFIAYKDLLSGKLQESANSCFRISIINLNNDDVHELAIFEGGADNPEVYLYTYSDGKAISLNKEDFPFFGDNGSFLYNPQNNKLCYRYDDYDSSSYYVYYLTFENKSINLDYSLNNCFVSDDAENVLEQRFYVNDKAVLGKEFHKLRNYLDSDIFNSNREELFYDDCIDVNTVENVEFALSTYYKRTQYDPTKNTIPESGDYIVDHIINEKYDSYKKAYEEVINSLESKNEYNDTEYALVYIDNDDIPELVTNRSCFLDIYTFLDGYLSNILSSLYGVGGCVEYCYAPYKNCISSFGHDAESYGDALYELIDGEIVQTFDISNYYDSDGVKYSNYTGEHLSREDIQKIYDETDSYKFEKLCGYYSATKALEILQKK